MDTRSHGELVALEHLLDTVQVDDSVVAVAGDDGPVLKPVRGDEELWAKPENTSNASHRSPLSATMVYLATPMNCTFPEGL